MAHTADVKFGSTLPSKSRYFSLASGTKIEKNRIVTSNLIRHILVYKSTLVIEKKVRVYPGGFRKDFTKKFYEKFIFLK